MSKRRLFVGDLHGCLEELNDLLEVFQFNQKKDTLFSVGDILGKGPHVEALLYRLKSLNTTIVRGNHDEALLHYSRLSPEMRQPHQQAYLDSLGKNPSLWLEEVSSWPYYWEMEDILLVHGGLSPLQPPSQTDPKILMNIRTWDGIGQDLKSESNPPWFDFIHPQKLIIFGHWAKMGKVNRPFFKGLDTGCVYGNQLTGYCPEEDLFYQVPSKKAYVKVPSKQ